MLLCGTFYFKQTLSTQYKVGSRSYFESVPLRILSKTNIFKMKFHMLILSFFVVATFAHYHPNGEGNGVRRHYRGNGRNSNQIAANVENGELEDTVLSEYEPITQRTLREKCNSGCTRNDSRRNGFRHNLEWHRRNGHNPEWHEKYGVPLPDEDRVNDDERKHHRHHHHRHHRNRTTTTTTTSTSAPSLTENEYFDNSGFKIKLPLNTFFFLLF